MNRMMIGFIFIFFCLIVLGKLFYGNEINLEISKYPDGKDFAFTITDDPDYGWMEEKLAIYDLLENLGFRTTIPVWVLNNKHGTGEEGVNSGVGGITTADDEYLQYTKEFKKRGLKLLCTRSGRGMI